MNNYDFAATSGTFTPLPASATQVAAMKADTYVMPATNIGFTFNFDGVNYTQFRASSNGLFSFNTGATTTTLNDLAATAAANRPLLAPLWDDLDGRATGGSNASYEVTGTAGSRVFTFEWLNWEFNLLSTAPVVSFQVKLYEGTNKIEFVYRPESGAVNSGSASVGIAGVGTGPGNFLSVNGFSATPTISYLTETSNIGTKPAAPLLYTFTRVAPSALDVTTTGLVSPATVTGCISQNQPVIVSIKNNGTAPIDFATTPATVNASVKTGTVTTNFPALTVSTGTLAPGATQNVTITSNFAITTPGTYTFDATTVVAGDTRAVNDAMFSANVNFSGRQLLAPLPQFVNFTGYTGANLEAVAEGWSEASTAAGTGSSSNWTDDDFANVTGGPYGAAARINLDGTTDRVWLVSPKVTATATTALKFDLALTTADATATATLGTDDQLQVMVSTDCGVTYTPVRTYSATTPISNTGQTETISLASFAGQDIVVALFATEGTVNDPEDNDLFIDNLYLGTPPALDLGANLLVAPIASGCYTANQTVTVRIENFGTNILDFAANPATVSVNVSGAVTQVITTTLSTGTLAPRAAMNVNVGTLNMTTAGTYTFVGETILTGDGNPANNNSTAISRTVAPILALPQVVNFTGFTGANLTAVFTGWSEADGIIPAGTSSSWTDANFANVAGHANGAAANINLDAATDKDWIIGPKVAASASTVLKFDLALTNDNVTTATTLGSDDALVVMVSTDCGTTFTPVQIYDASTSISNTGQTETVSLAAYAGQNIIVGFYATEGTVNDPQDNDLFLDNIFLGDIPTVTASGPTTFCTGGTVTLTAVTTIPGATYQWFENGVAIAGATSATYTASTAGSYTVAVTATAGGTATSIPTVVTVNTPAATPTITAGGATTFCSGGSVVLTAASSTTGATYEWFLNGIAISGTNTATYTASAAGAYTVVATANGCPSAASTATAVTVNAPAATPTITAGGATTFCSGGTVTLTAASTTAGATYQWFENGIAISGATNATYIVNASGSYTVVATASGCPSTASTATVVTANALTAIPTVTAGGATTICTGGSVALTAAATTAGATFQWFENGTAIAGATSATYTASTAGSYTVVATANGCPSAASTATVVTVNAVPATPTITQNGNVLTSSVTAGNQWFLNGTAISGATGASYTATANGSYTVVVTANGCDSAPSTAVVVNISGIAANLPGMSVDVYPNPTTGSFNVKLNGYQKDAAVVLYNLAGQQITSEKVAADGNAKNINLKGLAAGTYLLKVTSEKGVQVTRLIVQ
ncbi:T9SS type A sorting domain-containing protein [Adhaeribacter soli]|nr:T9SS type A sorting domain-containing protein [Adhaeribacter soli]